ncbi:MAG: diacylglycerol kinase family lipid kinase [Oscillospiraceae bacterium]|nr:diacylglycerol kinase family lipid kinase [Oscillospiraceae bacterium]
MKYVFIINPAAGSSDRSAVLKQTVSSVLERRNLPFDVHITTAPGDAIEFIRNYPTEAEDCCFVSCGGDGTLNEVITGAVGKPNTAVGVLPCGTGNDFVRSFGTMEIFTDLHNLLNGTFYDIDLLKWDNRYAINIFNMGFDAEVCKNMSIFRRVPILNKAPYPCSVLYSFAGNLYSNATLRFDDNEEITMPFLLASAANGVSYGGGFYAAPYAKVNDGLMDFCAVKKLPLYKIPPLIGIYKNGGHIDDEKVRQHLVLRRCRKLEITSEQPLTVCMDGEIFTDTHITLEIAEKALKFLVPHGGRI